MPDTVRMLPDPDQHRLLQTTLERVNRASNAARATGLARNALDAAALRPIVKDEVAQVGLPASFVTPVVERVSASLQRRTGKQPRFSTYQSLTLPASAFKWTASGDRVAMTTAAGRRTIAVRVDVARGGLRPPLDGRPATLVFRNGEFELVATD